jgi:hypothetical protein
MKSPIHFICILFLVFSCNIVQGQSLSPEVIGSTGDFYTSPAGSVSFTIGETVVETFNSGSNYLTQGFQQPFMLVTAIPETSVENSMFVYPNPVKNNLFLDFNNMEAGAYHIAIYDASGKKIMDKQIQINAQFLATEITFTDLMNGIYLVKINNEHTLNKTFKIVKQN